ncbi:alpha/beta fold hydrolase [Haloplanus sp. GCM10025708]|uniref:alpha/beta fold hydrolase n=1 Tax=Haloplanus sp. GCM10025708 TaxID=3252679 RepID=UPI0036213CC5
MGATRGAARRAVAATGVGRRRRHREPHRLLGEQTRPAALRRRGQAARSRLRPREPSGRPRSLAGAERRAHPAHRIRRLPRRLGRPLPLDGSLSLSDYVTRYLDNCVDAVRDRTGASQVDLLGYCMGGTMATMYAALEPEKVRRLGQLAAPLAFDGAGGVLERWATGVDPRALADDRGLVPADTLDACFRLVDPVENYVATYRRLLENVDDDAFVERFGRVEQWLRDGVDVPAAVFAEFVEACYRRDALRTGALTLDGRRIDPSRLTMPVAQIVGARDTLVPPAATREFADVVPGPVTPFEADVGHVGLAVSADAHDDLWPRVAAWYD